VHHLVELKSNRLTCIFFSILNFPIMCVISVYLEVIFRPFAPYVILRETSLFWLLSLFEYVAWNMFYYWLLRRNGNFDSIGGSLCRYIYSWNLEPTYTWLNLASTRMNIPFYCVPNWSYLNCICRVSTSFSLSFALISLILNVQEKTSMSSLCRG
jgi:hypothetical protein